MRRGDVMSPRPAYSSSCPLPSVVSASRDPPRPPSPFERQTREVGSQRVKELAAEIEKLSLVDIADLTTLLQARPNSRGLLMSSLAK